MGDAMSVSGAQFWTDLFLKTNGTPYAGVQVYHYAAGGNVDKDVWNSDAKTTPHLQPFIGDASGRVAFYGDGEYRLIIRSSIADGDLLLYDWDNVKIIGKSATLRAENQATSYPPATALNRGQFFAKTNAQGDVLEAGMQTGTAFKAFFFQQEALTGTQSWSKGVNIASAPTLTIGTDGNAFDVTGNTTITGLSETPAGTLILLRFTQSLLLQHHETRLRLGLKGNVQTQPDDLFMFLSLGSGNYELVASNVEQGPGSGRFAYLSGTTCLFSQYNGNVVPIAGRLRMIPLSGVSFTNASLAPSATYFAYVYMASGVMTGELSTVVPVIGSTYGFRTKTGDEARTLVGMIRTTASGFFTDTVTQRFVLSWFNRRWLNVSKAMGPVNVNVTSTTPTEVNPPDSRAEFLAWTDSAPIFAVAGQLGNDTNGRISNMGCRIDGIDTLGNMGTFHSWAVNVQGYIHARAISDVALTEGYHYASPYASVDLVSTATLVGGSSGNSVFTKGIVFG
jgi:hypothetical protein